MTGFVPIEEVEGHLDTRTWEPANDVVFDLTDPNAAHPSINLDELESVDWILSTEDVELLDENDD
ncbi:hypothetical protein [Knoellia subterranea]|uniref:hypothetical protein n=1 Tax=Knoellia subterranea TaxID=184882 RepID=UPI0012EC6000|nr:hypothetical protein [Knoellia subterranea]